MSKSTKTKTNFLNLFNASAISDILCECRESRKLVLLIVAIGLLLDNMLLTSVVPIIPTFLYNLHHNNNLSNYNIDKLNSSSPSSSLSFTVTKPSYLNSTNKQISIDFIKNISIFSNEFSSQCQTELERWLILKNNTHPLTTDINVNIENYNNNDDNNDDNNNNNNNVNVNVDNNDNDNNNNNNNYNNEISKNNQEHHSRHDELVKENSDVGIMFASKPVIQAITNLFVGPLTAKIGYSLPLFFGLILLFFSTMIFALGSSFFTLFVARSMQGVGSAFTSVAGMGLLAHKYPNDRERGNVMAIALGGLALGVLIGPPFGGIMYEFVGQSSPFITLAIFALFDGCLQLLVLQPEVVKQDDQGATLWALIQDPYILLAAGAITFANSGIAMLEPSLPLWMMDTMESSSWEQGAVFLPASISYLCGTNLFGPLGHKFGRWLTSMIGVLMIGFALLSIPFATSIAGLIIPNGMIGFAIGMVDSSMMPMLGYLVDIRHSSVYGSVYAIGDVALCVGYIIGPALAGTLVKYFGFDGLCMTTALVCFLFAPLMLYLRYPPSKVEKIELSECASTHDYQTMNYSKYSRFSIDSGTTSEFPEFIHLQQSQQTLQIKENENRNSFIEK